MRSLMFDVSESSVMPVVRKNSEAARAMSEAPRNKPVENLKYLNVRGHVDKA